MIDSKRPVSVLLVVLATAPATALAKPPPKTSNSTQAPHTAPQLTPAMLSAFPDALVSSAAGVQIAQVVLTQAWKDRTATPARRAAAVALALSALSSARLVITRALANKKLAPASRQRLQAQLAGVDKALGSARALPAKPGVAQVRKAATAASIALLEADARVGKLDKHGVVEVRAAAVNAIIGENGLVALIGENGSQALIGEEGLMAVNAIIGESGLAASAVAKTRGESKLGAPARALATSTRAAASALHGNKGAPAVRSALQQAGDASTALIAALRQL